MKNLFLLLAITLFIPFINVQAQDAESIIEEGVNLHDAGDYKAALKKYETVLKTDPDNPLALQEASLTAVAMKKYKECIDYCDRLIATDAPNALHGYMNKGTAYDLLDDYENAVATYKEGIAKYPAEYLLPFNLGVTYLKKEKFEEAEDEFLAALYRNSEHSSSNFMLGYTQYMLGNRVRSMLAFYYYLMLEPSGERSKMALSVLVELMSKGVEKESDQKININIAADRDTTDPFSTADFFLSILAASSFTGENKDKSDFEKFYDYTEGFASYMSGEPTKKSTNSPYVQLYVSFLAELKKKELLKTYCYSITRDAFEESSEWLSNNKDELSKLYNWFDAYTSHNSLRAEQPLRIDPNEKRKKKK